MLFLTRKLFYIYLVLFNMLQIKYNTIVNNITTADVVENFFKNYKYSLPLIKYMIRNDDEHW